VAGKKLAWLGKSAQRNDVSIWFPSWPIATASRETLMADEPCARMREHADLRLGLQPSSDGAAAQTALRRRKKEIQAH